METLLDLLPRIRGLGNREAVRFSNGLRTWIRSYEDLYSQVGAVVGFLDEHGIGKHDRLILWCENRPEWISVFWAALARGVELVPLDARTPADRVARIQQEVRARLIVTDNPAGRALPIDTLGMEEIRDLPLSGRFSPAAADPDDVVEIVYTSGTTAEPKGVIHRHRNIAANLTPVAREIDRYRRWARPFQPVRILDMLPFSHMFGQSIGIFVPPLLGGSIVLTTEMHPGDVTDRIRRERVSVLAAVPRLLTSLEAEVRRRHPSPDPRDAGPLPVTRRWWRYRAIHRDLGWKFWAFVVGGAELSPSSEAFWRGIGFAVIQGYGLTETSPVVAVNHPFHSRRGTLGKAIGNQEIRIAEDGEILVRGSSIVSEYLGPGAVREPVTDAEGWLHTGDIGAIDEGGRLLFRGRKKDMIVLPDGFNVYPEDVERILNEMPGVGDSAVVPARTAQGDRVHAALILADSAASPGDIIDQANRRLEPQQRIRSWSIWPEPEFPRTPSTMKIQRRSVAAQVREGSTPLGRPAPSGGGRLRDLLAEVSPATSPGDLSSLERVDFQALVEERLAIELDEAEFSGISTVGELEAYVDARRRAGPQKTAPPDEAPRWTRSRPARLARRVFQAGVIRPLLRLWVRVETSGLGNLNAESPPVIFASTHQSHFDVPVVARGLPPRWRSRLAPAMLEEYFFDASGWVSLRRAIEYYLVLAVFNAYPLPQRPGHIRSSLAYTGELVGAGYCPLVFPEGRRSEDGGIAPFRPGIGFMALQLQVPVVPVRVIGLSRVMPVGTRWPKRGSVRLAVGPAIRWRDGESYTDFASRLEAAVRSMS